jgi:hypothetical protein
VEAGDHQNDQIVKLCWVFYFRDNLVAVNKEPLSRAQQKHSLFLQAARCAKCPVLYLFVDARIRPPRPSRRRRVPGPAELNKSRMHVELEVVYSTCKLPRKSNPGSSGPLLSTDQTESRPRNTPGSTASATSLRLHPPWRSLTLTDPLLRVVA